MQRERLDARSFFQDQDRHNHFKVTPKQFKQTCHLLKCEITDQELQSIINVYGNQQAQIEYLPFLKDTFVLKYVINEPYTGKHSTYQEKVTDFSGAKEMQDLMQKVKDSVLRSRIRLGEFL